MPGTSVTQSLEQWLGRGAMLAHRHRYALAPVSFGIGLGSFFLVERRAGLAEWIAGVLLVLWLCGQAEVALGRRLKMAPGVLHFLTQQAHQETFFFTLPFLLRTTSWDSGQAAFTGAVVIAALCSMWDPLYFSGIAARAWLTLAFHALAAYLTMLVALPLILHLTTGETLFLATVAVGVMTVPVLAALVSGTHIRGRVRRGLLRWAAIFSGAIAVSLLAWVVRPWVPPATLWISQGVITQQVDVRARRPGPPLRTITPAALFDHGLYAYTAIHVPRGLNERVFHRWVQNGREVEKIPLDIIGGRDQGYRAWSHKQAFPAEPAGAWLVQVVTESGQLIGQIRFRVVGDYTGYDKNPS